MLLNALNVNIVNATVVPYMGGRVLRMTTDHQNDMARIKPLRKCTTYRLLRQKNIVH